MAALLDEMRLVKIWSIPIILALIILHPVDRRHIIHHRYLSLTWYDDPKHKKLPHIYSVALT